MEPPDLEGSRCYREVAIIGGYGHNMTPFFFMTRFFFHGCNISFLRNMLPLAYRLHMTLSRHIYETEPKQKQSADQFCCLLQ